MIKKIRTFIGDYDTWVRSLPYPQMLTVLVLMIVPCLIDLQIDKLIAAHMINRSTGTNVLQFILTIYDCFIWCLVFTPKRKR